MAQTSTPLAGPAERDVCEATGPPRPWLRKGLAVLRVSAALLVIDTLVQAALAGLFITGDVRLLDWHAANAQVLSLLAFVATAAAGLVWRPGRGPVGPFLLGAGLLVLIGVQQALGESRLLGGHVPLGMAIFGLVAALTYWAFTCVYGSDSTPSGADR
ncbi:hypothetical protein [Streptomyces sp. NPDC048436]|uniref:hypothetical protein n=1 Tax=Streptomyces sp. NPDC048436 TaxID=3365550 RepID=UPI00372039E9